MWQFLTSIKICSLPKHFALCECYYLLLFIHALVSDRTLLRALIWEPVQSFKVKAMQVAVGCWDWLLVARPELEYTVSNLIHIFDWICKNPTC